MKNLLVKLSLVLFSMGLVTSVAIAGKAHQKGVLYYVCYHANGGTVKMAGRHFSYHAPRHGLSMRVGDTTYIYRYVHGKPACVKKQGGICKVSFVHRNFDKDDKIHPTQTHSTYITRGPYTHTMPCSKL